jgi:acyl-CoA thioesterase II
VSQAKQPALEQFLGPLHLQDRGTRPFRGAPAPDADRHARMFGGQVLAQALAAGSFTVPIEWTCHSLHACLVRPGHSARPTDFQVFEMRDGKRGELRKVVAMQHDEVICELTASFAVDAEGPEHQLPMPPTAAADSFPSASACGTEGAGARQNFGPIELVLVDRRADTPARPNAGHLARIL